MADTEDAGVVEEVKSDSKSEPVQYKNPLGVSADEDAPEDFVRVCVIFPGLKKRRLRNGASNGNVDIKYESRSFTLLLDMKNQAKMVKEMDKYRYHIERLPADIDPVKCYHKIKKGQVVIFLKKVESKSWAKELSEGGLETYEDEGDNG